MAKLFATDCLYTYLFDYICVNEKKQNISAQDSSQLLWEIVGDLKPASWLHGLLKINPYAFTHTHKFIVFLKVIQFCLIKIFCSVNAALK